MTKNTRKNFLSLVQDNHVNFFRGNIMQQGINKAFKGDWGATPQTKQIGALQDLNRLSYSTVLSFSTEKICFAT